MNNKQEDINNKNNDKKEGNYVYPYEFDYNFYKKVYLDNNKRYNNEQIILDFIDNGYFNFRYGCIKEYCDYNYILPQQTKNIDFNNIIKNKDPKMLIIHKYWNTNFKKCIIIHAFNIDVFIEIIKNIKNTELLTFCNIIIVSPEKNVINYIRDNLKDIKMTLLCIKNKGMDTYGKLIAFKYILDNNLDFEWFLYLHTKTNINWFNDLIKPLLNKNVIDDIKNNTIGKDVYMIGSEDCKSILKISSEKYISVNLLLNKAGYKVNISDNSNVNEINKTEYKEENTNEIYAYWKLNIDLKYYINTYKEAYQHYKNNKNIEIRITLNDYINKTEHINYVAGTMYWSHIKLIYYYKNMLKFLLSTMNINTRIIYSEYKISTVHLSELLDGILIHINNKKILFLNGDNNNILLKDFNYVFYKLNNPDIPYTNKNSLVDHYLRYGIRENRQTSSSSYIFNNIYKYTDFTIFKNLGYVSNDYKHINYKGGDDHNHNHNHNHNYNHNHNHNHNYNYKYDKDVYYMYNIYTGLNTIINATNKQFILIITFGIGGGSSAFLNKLLHYYIFNRCVNIIIIKYNNGEYIINYNNLLINKGFNFEMITRFINKMSISIKHIFVNTFYTIPDNFKNFIYSLNIKKYTITHDYYNFFELPNPVYLHLKNKELYKNEINNFDVILTQHIYNISVMNYICPIKKEIHLIDFPDYCSNIPPNTTTPATTTITTPATTTITTPATTTTTTPATTTITTPATITNPYNPKNILIIGTIDYKKGSLLIDEIFNKFSNKYKFFIAGKIDNKNINQQEYKSIHEFNNILSLFKPGVILFTSLCPETYSYTLTLAMLTELPIIYYDIGDCVVSKRLEEYKFDSYKLSDINNFGIVVDNIDRVIQPKLIDNTISISKYWDNLFISDNTVSNNYENVVLITSKIYVSKNKFSYINMRSIYTKDERYTQTINTINSIKKYIPNVFIVLIDNSTFTENEKDILINNTNIFINHNDKILDYYTNNSEIKAVAELCQIKYALNIISTCNIKFNNFFKITGRYLINNNFVYDLYAKTYKNDNIFKQNKSIKDRLYYYTCFYKIAQNNFDEYIDKVNDLYNTLILKPYENIYNVIDLEFLLPAQLQFIEINNLGITQYISCSNEISDV
jgi:hypothetical protein